LGVQSTLQGLVVLGPANLFSSNQQTLILCVESTVEVTLLSGQLLDLLIDPVLERLIARARLPSRDFQVGFQRVSEVWNSFTDANIWHDFGGETSVTGYALYGYGRHWLSLKYWFRKRCFVLQTLFYLRNL
jgi:hypothetical protein